MGKLLAMLVVASACGRVLEIQPDAATTAGDAANAPSVVSVSVPTSIDAEGATAPIMASVHGMANEALTVVFTSTLGAYAPASVPVTTNSSGDATAATTFTSGLTAGTEAGTVQVTNAQSVSSLPKAFGFPVVALARYGDATAYGISGNFGLNYLLGESITVAAAGKLEKLGFISAAAGPLIQVGIYTDSAGSPGTLIAQLPITTIALGTNEVALTTPVAVSAAPYWFMAVYSNTGRTETDSGNTRSIKYITFTFGGALPTTYPVALSMAYSGQDLNYYLVVGQ